jgi:hypothetical protein
MQLSWDQLMYVVFLLYHRFCVVTALPLCCSKQAHAISVDDMQGRAKVVLRSSTRMHLIQKYHVIRGTSLMALRPTLNRTEFITIPRYRMFMTTSRDPFMNAPGLDLLGDRRSSAPNITRGTHDSTPDNTLDNTLDNGEDNGEGSVSASPYIIHIETHQLPWDAGHVVVARFATDHFHRQLAVDPTGDTTVDWPDLMQQHLTFLLKYRWGSTNRRELDDLPLISVSMVVH